MAEKNTKSKILSKAHMSMCQKAPYASHARS